MQMVVTHLTRMGPPYICAAGFEVKKSGANFAIGRRIRPVNGQLDRGLLKTLFQLGSMVDLGQTKPVGIPPEIEDYSFKPEKAKSVSRMSKAKFWAIIERHAGDNLNGIFGSALRQKTTSHGIGAVVDPGSGVASLGELLTNEIPQLYVTGFEQLRIKITDPILTALDLPVTDVRFFEYGQNDSVLKRAVVNNIGKQLNRSGSGDVILAVGLTRVYRGVHWLQVNNVFLKQDPLW